MVEEHQLEGVSVEGIVVVVRVAPALFGIYHGEHNKKLTTCVSSLPAS